jgi:hypothetical protein
MSTPLATNPATLVMATSETLPVVVDFTPQLLPGETISSATSSLTDTTNGLSVPVTLSDAPTVVNVIDGLGTSNGIQQILRGPTELVAQHTYRLSTNATISSTKIWSAVVIINVPF